MFSAKDTLRSLTPPIIWSLARQLKSSSKSSKSDSYDGPFPSWEAAVLHSNGWDSEEVTNKTLDVMIKVRDGLLEAEQDTVAKERIIYSVPILAFLLLVLSRNKNVLSFIDFGGGLGANYFQNRKLLGQLVTTKICWNIVERPIFEKLGIEHFQTSELNFFSMLGDALAKVTPTPGAILFSGSLQYVEEPFLLLEQTVDAGMDVIAFDRLPVSRGDGHAIYVQKLPRDVYGGATLPWREFSRDAFVGWFAEKRFTLVEFFEQDFNHCGMIFVKQR